MKEAEKKYGSVGKAMMYNAICIRDENGRVAKPGEVGELFIKGDHLYEYYWGQEEVNKERWFNTEDLAMCDEEGDYYIVGRTKDMIISGGENIYPQEIEKTLMQLAHVQDVAVVGVHDQTWGEVVACAVVLAQGMCTDETFLRNYCQNQLARYKTPKLYKFYDELPKTDVGKINKNTLKVQMEAGLRT
ncbi:class I adenylate-forming enzyme family protein [Geomicrobium sp. JCM 19039]|uniref:class I adenylate-forming enzyme family protein n=1 Tax=Geomicrobium sp. JCM 19039 TaxID=1460636 RepID=UPI0006936D81|nr:AMP-binding protein [Geomicrobium sp. JCM 19039]